MTLAQASRGQNASDWRVYKAEDGLYQSMCVSVSVAPNGTVLVQHPHGTFVTELDGYNVTPISLPEPAADVSESPGGQLWALVRNNVLQEFKQGVWVAHPVTEIASEFNIIAPPYPVRLGRVLFLDDDRLMEFNAESPKDSQMQVLLRNDQTRLEKFTDMVGAHDGGLWITGERGLGKAPRLAADVRLQNAWNDYLPPESPPIQNLRAPREDEEGGVTVIAESPATGQKVVAHFDGSGWTVQPVGLETVQRAWRSGDKSLWAMTTDALFRRAQGESGLAEYQEISAREYYEVAMEPGGTFWLATSRGLFHYAPPTWRSPPPIQQINSHVRCLTEDAASRLWFVAAGKLYSFQGDVHREFALPEGEMHESIHALFPLKDGTLLLDAGENPVRFNPDSGSFSAILPIRDNIRHVKPLGLLQDGSLCLQSWNAETTTGGMTTCYFDRYDGVQYKPLADPPPDLGFSTLFAARNGDLWLSSDKGIAWYHERKWRTFPVSDRTVPDAVRCFAELTDGRIWCATLDGLWEFDGHNWSSVRVGFDHINALQCAHDGSVWLADDAGVHRFFQNAWIDNSREEGLPDAAVDEIFEDQRGNIWAGTPHGLSLYHPEADPDPPRTFIQKQTGKEPRFREHETITLAFDGQDKWKFTPHDRLVYSYRLDQHDWSPFQEVNTVSFANLPVGRHFFQVRAMDRNGNIDPKPAFLEFAVTVPWYQEIRLVFIAFAGAAAALFFAALAFNRHRQLRRSYAEVEQKVAERTRELETASRELAQSQKMNALGTLAAGLAHDFNNILSIIKGSAQLIEENTDNPQKIRTRVDRIKTVVEQGAGIVNAMLGFSSGADEQPGPCDLNAVVADTLKLLGDRFLREVKVKFEPEPDLPEVRAAKNFIQQILLNFIFNAAEAMTARKQVILFTEKLEQLPGDLVLTPPPASAYVAVSVCDFGCGIPPENLPRIFEPFFTTKALSTRRGTGLGLSMVYELAKKMEAGITVESVVDRGSTFTLILPVRELPADSQPEL